jgi:hypothetical protein
MTDNMTDSNPKDVVELLAGKSDDAQVVVSHVLSTGHAFLCGYMTGEKKTAQGHLTT